MSLATGSRLGPYEIAALIGAGGMGKVYRARDTKLGRDVALKVLPVGLASDAEYMARFNREAHVLASLNHPHIASIYGLEESASITALVMELVEGLTLADRIKKGPLPLAEALDIAKQITEALEYAHEKSIIHRDLKPANVQLTPEGSVKLLDFGLAKAAERQPDSESFENVDTQPVSISQPGLIVGTPAYMSPEQARGEPVDKRTDIWAFGLVLLEMLTGKRTFGGKSTNETLAAVLSQSPTWDHLPSATPASIRRLLKRCLERDRKKRLQAIGEARIAIEEYPTDPVATVPPAQRATLGWVLSSGLLVALAALSFFYFRQRPPGNLLIQFSIPPPEKSPFMHLAPSPDGTILAFSSTGKHGLWLRRLDSLVSTPVEGGDDAFLPFWSPDGRYLGFWTLAQHRLRIIDVRAPSGPGRLRTLCEAAGPGGATWSRNGIIVFSGGPGQPLYRIAASGGEATALTKLDPSGLDRAHLWPWFLPDGRHYLYTVVSKKRENSGIYVGNLDSTERKQVLSDLSNAVYVAAPAQVGLLLFIRGDALMAQRFDASTLRLSAEPIVVAEKMDYDATWAQSSYAVSENGVLVYLSRNGLSQPTWFDRSGKRIGTVGEPATYEGGLSLSRDEKRVALARRDPNTGTSDIWLFEVNGGGSARLTFDPNDDVAPVWSPDGERLVFSSNRGGAFDLYQTYATGGGREELLLKSSVSKWGRDWSRDGRFLLYNESEHGTEGSLWILPLYGDHKPSPFQKTEFPGGKGSFSPDGRWVAFLSSDSGKTEIYVRALPGTEDSSTQQIGRTRGQWEISNSRAGIGVPWWRRDGKELYYLTDDNRFMSVELGSDPTPRAGIRRVLFEEPSLDPFEFQSGYAVTGDGSRFLVLSRIESPTRAATIVVNWTKGLKP